MAECKLSDWDSTINTPLKLSTNAAQLITII